MSGAGETYSTDLSWKDNLWLHAFGLSKETILEYFYTSPFFDASSNNQAIRTQGVDIRFLLDMVGVQYAVDEANSASQPSLFVIKKFWRQDSRTVNLLAVYYCLDGVIYESPDLLELLRSRAAKISNHLLKAYKCFEHVRKSPATKGNDEAESLSRPIQKLPAFDRCLDDLSKL
jgi:hypothetical protein